MFSKEQGTNSFRTKYFRKEKDCEEEREANAKVKVQKAN